MDGDWKSKWHESEEEKAFKDIPQHPIKLDFTGCKRIMQFHEILKVQLGLPEYYGKNWSALWDLMDGYRSYPTVIEIYGLNDLPKELQPVVEKMFVIFDRVHEYSPHIEFIRVS